MKTLLKTLAARIQRVRLAIAESDLRWMEARVPASLREQRAHVRRLADSIDSLEADCCNPCPDVVTTEHIRATCERRLKGALL